MSLNLITNDNRNSVRGSLQNAQLATAGDVNPVITVVNTLNDRVTDFPLVLAGLITATSTSTTTDFGSLVVGDKILVVPVAAGTPANTTGTYFLTCATAGTLPAAAVVGSLYVVLRSV
jgi:hypothetical protein